MHSDTGWPGHRLVSLLVYLRTPDAGGETCFFPENSRSFEKILSDVPASAYVRNCADILRSAGATCVSPAKGEALAWRNAWRNDGSLEVPGPHAACPVRSGEKWVGSAWFSEPCKDGEVCQLGLT
eukprot:TRINITY_DN76704_c0_g1_i1.p1 TRINITY_DN76704_c0_g1~~TRINITY_DN76704_c0_g1_i1.p1  ORF type:complete len:134 (-),score=10.61 TRINITY_DN76704_c0_g1_i1:170-544(-)